MRLGDIAHARAGDKGDISQISVIAYDPADYALLARMVTSDRVVAHFAGLPVSAVQRHEVPALGALNFVLRGALHGGVTRSLALDLHGKTLSAQLLDLEIEEPLGKGDTR
ncbi:AtuA-related protein [Sphingomonas sp.]|uniref:AtuA-related protein n=1 Tax=Sphingomonas sp. TaxID=28214 RepID=UPI003B3B47E3